MPQVLPQEHPGTIKTFGGATLPPSYLECDGSSLTTAAYPKLFAAIGHTHGGSGANFNIPDLRGVFVRGAGTNATTNFGGVSGHQPDGGALGTKGGQKTAKNGLTNSASSISGTANGGINLSHGHGVSDPGHTHNVTTTGFKIGANPGGGQILTGGSDTWNTGSKTTGISISASGALDHSHSVGGTADAQVISGDAETTPAFVALRYIIRV